MFDFELVPVIHKGIFEEESEVKNLIKKTMKTPSNLSDDRFFETPKEGVVVRTFDGFHSDMFYNNVFKYVRKNHVTTDEFWVRNWRRSKLRYELEKINK